ncbi:HEPN domain-containing protein [Sedimentisphaera salicampi]|uniref:hypothetical protein n=1 Tax=Sedimentisphaera salicampi TaxID=1941349 RepID=UPI000B9AC9A8|nr:hypothetical protein [Sedimentisphaera salicampi]OXU15613.1 HEPN domain protein [Sedimentisphaera salicampi]
MPLTEQQLKDKALCRIDDSKVLYQNGRFECANYICGYAIEMALKHVICRTLNWDTFPPESIALNKLTSFKTHDLKVLLSLSGIEQKVKRELSVDWYVVMNWSPEQRYSTQEINKVQASDMLESAENLVSNILE